MVSYGSELPDGYRPRIVDARIEHFLRTFGGVEIKGPKWCGKSWSALAFGESVVYVDLPSVKGLIESDPALALEGEAPHVVDEWQEAPAIWDCARHAIDVSGGRKGLYILTGSSTPRKEAVSHSGAGRIGRVDMSTMTLWEMGKASGGVSLRRLFEGDFKSSLQVEKGLPFYAEAVCSGGWPGLACQDGVDSVETVRQYLDALFEVSVPKKGGVSGTARRVAQSLARNVASAAKLKTIADDASEGESGAMAVSTVSFYLEILKDLYVIDELPGWEAPVRSKSRLRTKPKRYFADPSLAASLLGTSSQRLLGDGQTFGFLFESLCVHDLLVYARALPGAGRFPLRYYSDADGLEVDVIIELDDGRWAGIEIKLGENGVPSGVASLNRLRKKVASNQVARNPSPEFMAVLTANSPFARYDKQNDVYVFPLNALEP